MTTARGIASTRSVDAHRATSGCSSSARASRSAAPGCRPSRSAGWCCTCRTTAASPSGSRSRCSSSHAAVRRVGRRASPTASTSARCSSCTAGRHGRGRRAARGARRSPASSQLWMVYVIVFVFGHRARRSTTRPARRSCPRWSGPADLPNAIGLNSALFQVARIVGPAFAGVLIVAVGTGWCFALNAVSFVARHRRAAGDATPSELHRDGAGRPREGPGPRGPPLHLADARAAVDPAADARRRHARDQLPGGAAAAREGHVRRQRRHVQLDDGRRWVSARSSARSSSRTSGPTHAAACCS